MDKNCDNCVNSGRPSYEWPCTACTSAYGSAPSKWESTFSADDFVKVVRCKDCKFWEEAYGMDGKMGYCATVSDQHGGFAIWYPDDFCSYGERKDSNG